MTYSRIRRVKSAGARWQFCYLIAALVVFGNLLYPIDSHSQSKELVLNGIVRGVDGDPKQFARVKLEGPNSYIALTNAKGQFTIKDLMPGRYRITVTQTGKVQTVVLPIEKDTIEVVVKW